MKSIELKVNDCKVKRIDDKIKVNVVFTNEHGVELHGTFSTNIETMSGFSGCYYG